MHHIIVRLVVYICMIKTVKILAELVAFIKHKRLMVGNNKLFLIADPNRDLQIWDLSKF